MFLLNVVLAWVMTATTAPLAEGKRTMCAKDYEPERADGRTSRTMTWAMLKLRQANPPRDNPVLADSETFLAWRKDDLAGRAKALAGVSADPDFKLLKEERRTGYALRTYEFYPEDGLAVRTLVLVPDGVPRWMTSVEVIFGKNGASVEHLAGEPDPYRAPDGDHLAQVAAKAGKIAIALALPGEANGAPDDVNSTDSRTTYLALLPDSGWTDERLKDLERTMCVDYVRGREKNGVRE